MEIQLIYMSAATPQFDSFELTDLLVAARQKNQTLDISGMLVYHDGSFLQILEGKEEAIGKLYDRVTRDDRHTNCQLLIRSYIDKRSFGDWTMGFVDTRLDAQKRRRGFHDFFGEQFSRQTFITDPSVPRKLLLAFRDGTLRQTVDS